MTNKCDGNHGGPRCGDPECWNDTPRDFHKEAGWQGHYGGPSEGQQYRCIVCGIAGASGSEGIKPLTYNCHNPECSGDKHTMWPTPQYAKYREQVLLGLKVQQELERCQAGGQLLVRDRNELQAEVDRLKPLSVTHIMLDVVPGEDGMGEEVYAKSVLEVEEALGRMGERVEDLESELAKATADKNAYAQNAIDLRRRAESLDAANKEWFDKTDWMVKTIPVLALGRHRADVMSERIWLLKDDIAKARELLNLADHYLEENSFNSVGEVVEHTQEMREDFRRTIQAYLTGA